MPALIKFILIFLLTPLSFFLAFDYSHKSKYAGEEKREIKSLSETDIEELKTGKGWGLAGTAELNGVPGPANLLEMNEEIDPSAKQIQAIEDLYKNLNKLSTFARLNVARILKIYRFTLLGTIPFKGSG